jgi:hypothetical protein
VETSASQAAEAQNTDDHSLDREGNTDASTKHPTKAESFTERDREEAHRRLLRARGFDLEYDPHGFRLKKATSKRGTQITELSPYDIVRLASEFEGEVAPPEERMHCPNCEAVVSPKDVRCQWCTHPLQE